MSLKLMLMYSPLKILFKTLSKAKRKPMVRLEEDNECQVPWVTASRNKAPSVIVSYCTRALSKHGNFLRKARGKSPQISSQSLILVNCGLQLLT